MPHKCSTYSFALEIAVQLFLTGLVFMISVAHIIGVPGFAHHRPRAVPLTDSADHTPHSAIFNANGYCGDSSSKSTCACALILLFSQKRCIHQQTSFRTTFVVSFRCGRLDRLAASGQFRSRMHLAALLRWELQCTCAELP